MIRTSSRLAAVAEKAKAKALAEEQDRIAQAAASAIKVEQDANANVVPLRKKKRVQPNTKSSTDTVTDDKARREQTHKPKQDATAAVFKEPAALKRDPVKKEEGSVDLEATRRSSNKKQGVHPEHYTADPTTSSASDNPTTTVHTTRAKSTSATAGKAGKLKTQGKKRKVDEKDEYISDDDHGARGSESEAIKGAKKQRRNAKQDAASGVEKRPEVPKGTNPCAWLPTEVWHVILSYLPLSQVAVISLVNTTWLDGCRTYPAWKTICEKNNVGPPKSKYKSYMALACKHSYFICDRCHSLTMKGQTKSEVTLPIKDKDDDGAVWLLCRDCRLAYYSRHPLKLKNKKDANGHVNRITRTRASYEYQLTTWDLDTLPCAVHRNPHYRNGPPMRLYNEIKVERLALKIHGGHCGIAAAASDVIKKKRDAFRRRDANFSKPPTVRLPQEHGSQEQSSQELAIKKEQVSQEQSSQELAIKKEQVSQEQSSQELAIKQEQVSQEQSSQEFAVKKEQVSQKQVFPEQAMALKTQE